MVEILMKVISLVAGNGFTKDVTTDKLYDAKVDLMIEDWQKLSKVLIPHSDLQKSCSRSRLI